MLNDGVRSVVSANMQQTRLSKPVQKVSQSINTDTKIPASLTTREGVGQSGPAAKLELSDEGVRRSESEKARQALSAVKESLKKEQLSDIHSNLRSMRVNQLIFD